MNDSTFINVDDSISFDYDYITETENYDEENKRYIPVSW
jgi:hypothetical protein